MRRGQRFVTSNRVLRRVVTTVLTMATVGSGLQALASRRDRAGYPAPGRMVDVGGHRLHVRITGDATDAPTVVLEAGMASMSSNWAWVRDRLAGSTRVITYDRAGLGWSERSGAAVDAAASASQLHAALGVAGVGPPYVLAGHS